MSVNKRHRDTYATYPHRMDEFEATQAIGDRLRALADVELDAAAEQPIPPDVRARLDQIGAAVRDTRFTHG